MSGARNLSRTPSGLLAIIAVSGLAAAQAAPRPAPGAVLAAFDQGEGWLQELDLPAVATGKHTVELFLDGSLRTVVYAPYSLRTDDYQLLVQGSDGEIEAVDPGPVTTVRGFVAGYPESFLAASLVNGQLSGIIRLRRDEPLWGVQPLTEIDPGEDASRHLIYDGAQAPLLPYTCGTPDEARPSDEPGSTGSAADGGPGSSWVEIACDADTQFFAKCGSSVTLTQNDVTNVINGVDAIFDSDFDIRYLIGTILVRTSEPDPYTTSASSPLLSEFKIEWVTNQSGVKRDIAHLFTGKNLSGSVIGVAYIGGMCSLGSGYGLSQSKFTGSMTYRVGLTAHELGHNWTASHCNGTPQCWIMCSGIGGCAGGLTQFGPSASAEIEAKEALIQCKSGPPPTVPPVLTSASPSTTTAFLPKVIDVSGSGFEWAEEVKLGGQVLSSPGGYISTSDNQLWLTFDSPSSIGATPLVVTNAIGPSNALNITFTETFPPLLQNYTWVFSDQSYTWSLGGEIGDLWFLAVSVGNLQTVPLLGYEVLLGSIMIGSGTLDGVGLSSAQAMILPSAIGTLFYSQAVVIDGGTGQFRGATNITAAYVLL